MRVRRTGGFAARAAQRSVYMEFRLDPRVSAIECPVILRVFRGGRFFNETRYVSGAELAADTFTCKYEIGSVSARGDEVVVTVAAEE